MLLQEDKIRSFKTMLQMFRSLGGTYHHLLGCSVLGKQAEDTKRFNELDLSRRMMLGIEDNGSHLSILRRNVCRSECRNHDAKQRVCALGKARRWPIKADGSAGFDKCGS